MTELAALILRDAIRSATTKSEHKKRAEIKSTRDHKSHKQVQSRNLEIMMKAMKKQQVTILLERLEFWISLPRAPIEYCDIEESWQAATLELKQRVIWLRSEVLSKSG